MPPLMPRAISRAGLSGIRPLGMGGELGILARFLRDVGLPCRDKSLPDLLLGDGGGLSRSAVHPRPCAPLELLAARGGDTDELELVFHGLHLHAPLSLI